MLNILNFLLLQESACKVGNQKQNTIMSRLTARATLDVEKLYLKKYIDYV